MDLYINGSRCDLFGDEEVVINKSVNNIGDIQYRDGDYTNNFDLPLTATNKLIFENSHVLNSGSDIPYQRLTARIEVNGNIISIGYAVLLEGSDVYRVSYYGANADWFATIGNKKLSDLDLTAYNHLWTATNVRDARLNNTAWTDVYNYPNVDYGQWESGTVYWYQFYPGMFAKYLIWKIFDEAGFTINGNLWDVNSYLLKEFIPFCGSFKRDRVYANRNDGEWDTPYTDASIPLQNVTLTNTVSSTNYNILNDTTGLLTILDNVTLSFTVEITVSNSVIAPTTANYELIMYYIDTSGAAQSVSLFTLTGIAIGGSVTVSNTFNISMQQCVVTFKSGFTSGIPTLTAMNFEITGYDVDESTDDYLSIDETFNYVTLASTLPDVMQKDLLVTFFNQYCIMTDTDHQTNYVNIFSLLDVAGNIPNAVDWSNKIDLTRKPVITYLFNEYAQTNKFLYKEDDQNQYLLDFPEFAGGEILIDNENLEIEKVVFQSEFASIIRQSDSFGGTARFAWIPKFPSGDEVECAPYIGVIEFENIHLITMDGYAQEPTQPAMHELSFETHLLPNYYTTLENIMVQAKVVNAWLMLNSVDIQQLDFSKPVYLDYFDAYFYVNQVKQFKATNVETTQVELVRL